MRFILVSADDPNIKKAIDIPKEIVTGLNKTNPQSTVTKPIKPTEPPAKRRKKSHQSSKSIING